VAGDASTRGASAHSSGAAGDSPAPKARHGRLELALVALAVFAVGWSYIADARRVEGYLTSRQPPGYYGLLTEALLEGHFNLNVTTDPLLLRLANPYAGPQGTVRPHDMSFYRGKFYIYYGITPAVLLMVPWKVLTGNYLREIAATAIFCFGAFALGAFWLVGVRRRLFPNVSAGWTLLAVLVLGYGSPTFFLSDNPTFYAVPIAGACFCLMAALILVDRAMRATGLNRSALWLAGASLAMGLAVGSRPHYAPCLGLLLLPAGWLWFRIPRPNLGRKRGARLWAAAILPAAAVGAALAYYNWRRFDNPLDFGIRYSMASGDLRNAHLLGFESFRRNLHTYLLAPSSLLRYYPFLFSTGQPMGVVRHLSLIAAAALFPLTLLKRRFRSDPAWPVTGLFLLGAGVLNLAILCTWVLGGMDRYLVDFVPPALLLACAVLLALVDGSAGWSPAVRRPWAVVLLAAALWTMANGTFLGIATRVATPFRARLEYASDHVVYAVERAFGVRQGPVELTLKFPATAVGRRDPLISTGNLVGTGDIVFVRYADAGHVQFGFFHLGAGGPVGDPVAVDYSVAHTVVIELGSLYPPRRHPMFDAWSDEQVAALRRHLEVRLDGHSVFRAEAAVYPSMPNGVFAGENRLAPDVSMPRFEGEILGQRRLGLAPAPAVVAYPGGPVRLHLRWPRGVGANEPLVCTGRSGAGDLLNAQMLPGGFVRFEHDSWNNSDMVSDPVATDVAAEHDVDVEMGSLYCDPKVPVSDAQRRRLAIWVDGKLAIDMDRPFNESTPQEVEFGYNAIGGSSGTAMFTGTILRWACIPPRPIPPEADEWGPIRMTVRFRNDDLGITEPLLTTGMGDEARILYVHYVDARHVFFGYDRAGKGGDQGPTVEMNFAVPHTVEIALGSLFPGQDSPKWAALGPSVAEARHSRMEVRLDGQVVFQAEHPVGPASHRVVTVGRNDVNTTHCLRTFGGQISEVVREPW
jgi:hypothetical protein